MLQSVQFAATISSQQTLAHEMQALAVSRSTQRYFVQMFTQGFLHWCMYVHVNPLNPHVINTYVYIDTHMYIYTLAAHTWQAALPCMTRLSYTCHKLQKIAITLSKLFPSLQYLYTNIAKNHHICIFDLKSCCSISLYSVAKTHRMPYLYRSFISAKEPYNWWLFCEKWPATSGILWVFATL